MKNGGQLSTAFHSFFEYLTAGMNYQARETNGKEMTFFFWQLLQDNYCAIKFDENIVGYLKRQWFAITELIGENNSCGQILLDELRDSEYPIRPDEYVKVIIENWELVGNNTYTFRFLSYLAKHMGENLLDTSNRREKYLRILIETSNEWQC